MNPITLALYAGLVFSENGSTVTKLSPPSSSAAMLSTVTHCWTMSFRMFPDSLMIRQCLESRPLPCMVPKRVATAPTLSPTLGSMTVYRMDHVGVVVEDLPAAIAFFVELGLELEGQTTVEDEWADKLIGLEGVRSDIAMLRTPDGHSRVEVSMFHSPVATSGPPRAPVNVPGISRLTFVV